MAAYFDYPSDEETNCPLESNLLESLPIPCRARSSKRKRIRTYTDQKRHNGVSYFRLGAYAEVLPFIEQALRIRTKIFGPQHPNTLSICQEPGRN